jgi:hypothetical protein
MSITLDTEQERVARVLVDRFGWPEDAARAALPEEGYSVSRLHVPIHARYVTIRADAAIRVGTSPGLADGYDYVPSHRTYVMPVEDTESIYVRINASSGVCTISYAWDTGPERVMPLRGPL